MQNLNKDEGKPEQIGMPVRPFLYTVDQVCTLLQIKENTLRKLWLYYDRRSTGPRRRDLLLVHDISPEGVDPEWRCTERELIRWLRARGIRVVDRHWATH
jgi:phage antirepressor YoqD-like protein